MEIPITAKAALLQVLLEGPGYPLELAARVESRTKGKVKLLQGSIYPALEKFVEAGLAVFYRVRHVYERPPTAEVSEGSMLNESGRSHVFYHLTDAGKKLAEEQRAILIGLAGKKESAA